MEISLRPFRPEDQEVLFAIYASTRREEVAAWGWPAAQQDAFLRMQFKAQQGGYAATYPDAEHQIVCAGAQPIGRILVERASGGLHLVDIALLAEHRGQGIGTMLLRRLTEESDRQRVPVRLQVQTTNVGARRLYERLGFRATGENQIYCEMERPPV
ncbi:MAG TPA: GNAT family N-acetyltransferase [Verrucomicrobiae bacterium]|jgi:ribosomal protein S18 acetylase RimI-like enzyme|nr:GNAT family N-acetyltransferase [Verrucomicrobiae bacterium]